MTTQGPRGYSVYAATKAGVETLTNIFAKELRGRDIAVNAIAPGPTATELFLNDKTPEQIEHVAKLPPMERLAQPQDIANVVAFLVGPDAGWVDGRRRCVSVAGWSDQTPESRRTVV